MYKCHNCGCNHNFSYFLKLQDESSYKEYQLRAFKENMGVRESRAVVETIEADVPKKPKTIPLSVLDYLSTIAELPNEHHCKQYVMSRRIPVFQYDKMFYTDDFAELAKKIDPDVSGLRSSEERLVLPMINEDGELLGIIGRDLKPKSKLRYISIKVSPTSEKVFGINRINKKERVFVLEGAIDSMFVKNGMAVAGSGLTSVRLDIPPKNVVYVFDNEPRNKEISNMLQSTINNGYNVVIFPSGIREKDINDMVLNNIDVNTLLNENVYTGLEAKARFSSWLKL